MRKLTSVLLLTATALLCPLSGVLVAADIYKLISVKRLEKDLYRSGKVLVLTRYCYHYTYGEDAILKYEGNGEYSGSKIIWDDDSSCEVKRVIVE